MIVVVDNQDSFVHNLAAQFEDLGHDVKVIRNTAPVEAILDGSPDLICLSPGPGTPQTAGNLMQVVSSALGNIPLLGICLGFQALIEHAGGRVEPVRPVHGESHPLILTDEGAADPVFARLGGRREDLAVGRYQSLGARSVPEPMQVLAMADDLVMAARWREKAALGFYFHPESVLTARGTDITRAAVADLLGNTDGRENTDTPGSTGGIDSNSPFAESK